MTPAEIRFKNEVKRLVRRGIYPSPAACGSELGRTGTRSIDGRETRWRRAVLLNLGWAERPRSARRRFSFVPPRGWRRSLVAVFLLALLPAMAGAQTPAPTAPDPLAASTYAAIYATETQVTGLTAEPQRYIGSRLIAQLGMGHFGLWLRADVAGAPGSFERTKPDTYQSGEAFLGLKWNALSRGGMTLGPLVMAGYAISLDNLRPTFPHSGTAGAGVQVQAGEKTALVAVGMCQYVPGLAVMAAAMWPLAQVGPVKTYVHADFGYGAGQKFGRVAISAEIKGWRL